MKSINGSKNNDDDGRIVDFNILELEVVLIITVAVILIALSTVITVISISFNICSDVRRGRNKINI